MNPDKPKNTHGGKRREGTTQTHVSMSIDNDLLNLLSQTEGKNRSRIVNQILRNHFYPAIEPTPTPNGS